MFEPGHVHRISSPNSPFGKSYTIDFYYDVRKDPEHGLMLHGRLLGDIDGQPFEDEFDLYRDTAYNFASVIARLLAKRGLPSQKGGVMYQREEYEAMYTDIRHKLGLQSGEPINLDHLY